MESIDYSVEEYIKECWISKIKKTIGEEVQKSQSLEMFIVIFITVIIQKLYALKHYDNCGNSTDLSL